MEYKTAFKCTALLWVGVSMATVNNAPLLENLEVTSHAFKEGEEIPALYACKEVSPQLAWSQVPQTTKSIAIICDDPDAVPVFTHWVVFNIPSVTKSVHRGETTKGAVVARNSKNTTTFFGPCPPAGRVHHYHFRVYALDTMLALDQTATREQVERALETHILAKGELVGTYESKS